MPDRFSQVSENIYRSGCPEIKELPVLKEVWGINKIVSLDASCAKKIAAACKELDIIHTVYPIESNNFETSLKKLPSKLDDFLEDGPVLIHCFHGKDRTGLVCAMIRKLEGWDTDKALKEALTFGFGKGLSPKVVKLYTDTLENYDPVKEDFNEAMALVGINNQALPSAPGSKAAIIEPYGGTQYSNWNLSY